MLRVGIIKLTEYLQNVVTDPRSFKDGSRKLRLYVSIIARMELHYERNAVLNRRKPEGIIQKYKIATLGLA